MIIVSRSAEPSRTVDFEMPLGVENESLRQTSLTKAVVFLREVDGLERSPVIQKAQ